MNHYLGVSFVTRQYGTAIDRLICMFTVQILFEKQGNCLYL